MVKFTFIKRNKHQGFKMRKLWIGYFDDSGLSYKSHFDASMVTILGPSNCFCYVLQTLTVSLALFLFYSPLLSHSFLLSITLFHSLLLLLSLSLTHSCTCSLYLLLSPLTLSYPGSSTSPLLPPQVLLSPWRVYVKWDCPSSQKKKIMILTRLRDYEIWRHVFLLLITAVRFLISCQFWGQFPETKLRVNFL